MTNKFVFGNNLADEDFGIKICRLKKNTMMWKVYQHWCSNFVIHQNFYTKRLNFGSNALMYTMRIAIEDTKHEIRLQNPSIKCVIFIFHYSDSRRIYLHLCHHSLVVIYRPIWSSIRFHCAWFHYIFLYYPKMCGSAIFSAIITSVGKRRQQKKNSKPTQTERIYKRSIKWNGFFRHWNRYRVQSFI
jgi:hypothetical protein